MKMISGFAMAGMLTPMASCASTAPEGNDAIPVHGAGSCDSAKAQTLVGQPASSDLAARAQMLSGAGIVRWLQPGQIVTLEYRADRLNIVLDEKNVVTSIRCG